MKVFLDTSVIIAALFSESGGSAQIIEFCEAGILQGVISADVEKELHEVVERKFPEVFPKMKRVLKAAACSVVRKIPSTLLRTAKTWVAHLPDAKILAAAKHAKADFLITLDIRHFIMDPKPAEKSKLKILTPGDFLKHFHQSF